jgi:two-component system sensor histidine kinase QseC
MNSLRVRLVGFTLLAVGVVWLATAYVVWNETHHELDELMKSLPAAVRGELESEHEEIVEEIAEHLAKPLLVAFPILAALLILAVTLALRPLQRLATQIASRAPDHLDPLPVTGTPAEVRPLIERLNHLFGDLNRVLENERRFTADAAHELRTPLAALKTQAQVAQGATGPADQQRALAQIVVGCDRATHLVEQLLTLARLDAPPKEGLIAVDLQAIAAEVLSALAGDTIQHGAAVSLTGQERVAVVQGDPVLLRVLLRNLIDNALRHTPPGTAISVDVDADATGTHLRVRDQGPGLTTAECHDVMQRFHRSPDALGEGSGLGLSIVQRIAELHGARFSLHPTSAAQAGTTAELFFKASAN